MIKFGDIVLKDGDKWLTDNIPPDPYNPLNLPPNTVRVRTSDGNVPVKGSSTTYETATLVEGTSDIYDVYKSGRSFAYLLYSSTNVSEVLGANTTGITDMKYMFYNCKLINTVPLFDTSIVTSMECMFGSCTSLTTVPLFDTSSVTHMNTMFRNCTSLTTVPLFGTSGVKYMDHMFEDCSSLTYVPLFDTSSVTTMHYMFEDCSSLTHVPLFNTSSVKLYIQRMFYNCYNVESGALALYQQVSAQATSMLNHSAMFYNCGINTTTGAAELAQIPSGWK